MLNTRALAVTVLERVLYGGESFHPSLIAAMAPQLPREDQAFVSNLCFGVCRSYFRLQVCVNQLIEKPLKAKDHDIELLLLVGLYQLLYLNTPEYAALHATVEAVPKKKAWARQLLNGVLREAQRQKDYLIAHPLSSLKLAHPKWLQEAIQAAWPAEWKNIIAANLSHPPLSLRINPRKTSLSAYCALLADPNTHIETWPCCPTGLMLSPPRDVTTLPGFRDGWVSVQDGAAQLAATLLDLQENQRILDACAAPGGKTAHICEIAPDTCEVWALDQDPQRLERLQDNLKRLDLVTHTQCIDAGDTTMWWDGRPFDRILLDVPCSATGVIRRHPDIQHHRQPSDIPTLIAQQQFLLTKMWPLLRPGGILLYATCSLLPAENVDQMAWFLKSHPDAEESVMQGTWGLPQHIGRQILPGQDNMDGFYYARLRKRT